MSRRWPARDCAARNWSERSPAAGRSATRRDRPGTGRPHDQQGNRATPPPEPDGQDQGDSAGAPPARSAVGHHDRHHQWAPGPGRPPAEIRRASGTAPDSDRGAGRCGRGPAWTDRGGAADGLGPAARWSCGDDHVVEDRWSREGPSAPPWVVTTRGVPPLPVRDRARCIGPGWRGPPRHRASPGPDGGGVGSMAATARNSESRPVRSGPDGDPLARAVAESSTRRAPGQRRPARRRPPWPTRSRSRRTDERADVGHHLHPVRSESSKSRTISSPRAGQGRPVQQAQPIAGDVGADAGEVTQAVAAPGRAHRDQGLAVLGSGLPRSSSSSQSTGMGTGWTVTVALGPMPPAGPRGRSCRSTTAAGARGRRRPGLQVGATEEKRRRAPAPSSGGTRTRRAPGWAAGAAPRRPGWGTAATIAAASSQTGSVPPRSDAPTADAGQGEPRLPTSASLADSSHPDAPDAAGPAGPVGALHQAAETSSGQRHGQQHQLFGARGERRPRR